MKFSIIIPAYNTELYIEECITSIVNQNYHDYELLIIDDGSSDSTFNIIKTYQAKYPAKIFCWQIDHKGVSAARNVGIRNAKGDYVIFVDSDDYIKPDSLKKLEKIIDKYYPEVLIGEFDCFSEDENIPILNSEKLSSSSINNRSQEQVLNYLYLKRLIFTLWRFVVKRSLIIENNLYLVEGIIHEDEEWVPRMLLCANNFRKIPFRHYVYRKHKNSIMASKTLFNCHCMLKIADDMLLKAEKQDQDYKKYFLLRNSYKLASNAYRDIRKQAKYHKGLKYYGIYRDKKRK